MKPALAALVAVNLFVPAASAGLAGATLTGEWLFPDSSSVIESDTFVVGPGVEFPFGAFATAPHLAIDLADDTVTFSFSSNGSWTTGVFNGWRFTDTNGTIAAIASYTVGAHSAGMGNLGVIQTVITPDSFAANFADMTIADTGNFITMRVTFVPTSGAVATCGLAVLFVPRRRR